MKLLTLLLLTLAPNAHAALVWRCDATVPGNRTYSFESPSQALAQRHALTNCSVIEGSWGGRFCRIQRCVRIPLRHVRAPAPSRDEQGTMPSYCDMHPTAAACQFNDQLRCRSTPSDPSCAPDYCSYHMTDDACRP